MLLQGLLFAGTALVVGFGVWLMLKIRQHVAAQVLEVGARGARVVGQLGQAERRVLALFEELERRQAASIAALQAERDGISANVAEMIAGAQTVAATAKAIEDEVARLHGEAREVTARLALIAHDSIEQLAAVVQQATTLARAAGLQPPAGPQAS